MEGSPVKCARGSGCWFSHERKQHNQQSASSVEDQDFQQSPTRRLYSFVVGAQTSQMHQVSEQIQTKYSPSNTTNIDKNYAQPSRQNLVIPKATLNRNSYEQSVPANHNLDFNEPLKETYKHSLVFNYSDVEVTESMDKLLNRGLNFSVLPNKMDLTQVLTDFK